MTTKAYSYLRFSTPDQMRGDSFRRQTALAAEYAAKHGLELDEGLTFRDLGVSAFRGSNVAAGKLGEFQEAVRQGLVPRGSFLLVESLDRISRDQIIEAQSLFLSIVVSGITLVTLQDSKVYSRETINANPTDLIMSIVILMRAHEESLTKAKRLRAAWENKRRQLREKPMTAKAPAWLRLVDGKFEVDTQKARVVKRIFADALAGYGQHAITDRLNKSNTPTFGKAPHWRRSSVVKILDSPAVVGTFIPCIIVYEGRKKIRKPQAPVEGYYPPVVDLDTYDRVRLLRDQTASPQRGRHSKTEVRNIVGGIALCPECNASMTRVDKGKRSTPKLVCSASKAGAVKHYHSVNYTDVEKAIVARRREIVRKCPGATEGAKALDREIKQTEATILETEDKLDDLLDLPGKPSKTVGQRIAELEAYLGQLQATLATLRTRRRAADGVMLRARLGELEVILGEDPLDRQKANAALRQVLSGVVIDYENGELDFRWHHSETESSIMYALPIESDRKKEKVSRA